MTLKKYIIFICVGILFFLGLVSVRYEGTHSISSLMNSWMLLASKGQYGNENKLIGLGELSGYREELLGDISYQRGDELHALDSYKKSLEYADNERVQIKISILEQTNTGKNTDEIPKKTDEIIEGTLERIKNDTFHRSDFVPSAGSTYTTNTSFFEVREKDIIDW